MSSTPGPSPNASSSAMPKSECTTTSGRQLAADERLPQRLSLVLAAGAGDADAEHARRHVRHARRLERLANDVGDDPRRRVRVSGNDGAARPERLADGGAAVVRDDGVGLRAATVDANHDLRHVVGSAGLGGGAG